LKSTSENSLDQRLKTASVGKNPRCDADFFAIFDRLKQNARRRECHLKRAAPVKSRTAGINSS
jgi:hypothetical protein